MSLIALERFDQQIASLTSNDIVARLYRAKSAELRIRAQLILSIQRRDDTQVTSLSEELFGSPLPLGTVLRTLGAGTIIWLIGQQVTTSVTLYLLLSLIMLGLLFLIIIYVSGEWTAEEKAMVKARFTRKRESR